MHADGFVAVDYLQHYRHIIIIKHILEHFALIKSLVNFKENLRSEKALHCTSLVFWKIPAFLCTQLMNYLLINKQTAWYRTVQSIWRWMGLIPDKVLLFCIIKGEEQLWVISDIAYNSLYEGVNTVSCVKCNLFLRRFSSWLKIQSTKVTLLFNIRKNIK